MADRAAAGWPVSIVIPAHNESRVIERCLTSVTAGRSPGELDVVVVCNGCTDDTAEKTRRFPYPVRLVETTKASKPHALNLGDEAAGYFPRFYVDADVVLSGSAVADVATALAERRALAAAPKLVVDLAGTTWPVRAYYRTWLELPYCRTAMIGSGFYALSEAGRARFGEFPDTLAEDEFVRRLFSPEERLSVETCAFVVFPPSRARDLLTIRARGRVGGFQVARLLPQGVQPDRKPLGPALRRLATRPHLWPCVPVYGLITGLAWMRARRRWREGDYHWDQDASSRARTAG